jgi:hypothetical protein
MTLFKGGSFMQVSRILKGLLSGISLALLTAPAFAEMSLPYGWYLEAIAGSSTLSSNPYHGNVSSSGIGYNANLGYKFMPYVGAELGYTQYANATVKNAAGNKAGIGKYYSWDIAAKGILPFSDSGFEAFAKLGVQRLATNMSIKNSTIANGIGLSSGSHSTTNLYYGAGLQYYFMPEFAVNAQWMRANGNSATGTESLLSAGLSFIFG